jgi:uncharacterized protein YsxB (DUF464 family)
MILAEFFQSSSDKRLLGFAVSGHAGTAESGQDIVCASVSSAVMMTANNVTEFFGEAFGLKAKVQVLENDILLKLTEDTEGIGDRLLLGLLTHLYMVSEEFPEAVRVKISER